MNIWFIIGLLFLVVLPLALLDFWVSVVKKRIYRAFKSDEERWWFLFYLKREVRAPGFVVEKALELIREEIGIETKIVSIQGMYELVGSAVMPVTQAVYRIRNTPGGGSRVGSKKHKLVPAGTLI